MKHSYSNLEMRLSDAACIERGTSSLQLMERAGVVVTPGASFGPHGEGYVRMALVLPPDGLRAAVAAIEAAGIR